jgi:membrane-associated protease RseP (regulator of RpoE activity)
MPPKKNPEAEAPKSARTQRAAAATPPPEPTPEPKRDHTFLWAVAFLAAAVLFAAGYFVGHAVGEDDRGDRMAHYGPGVIVMGDTHCCRPGHGYEMPGMPPGMYPMPGMELYPPYVGEGSGEIIIDGNGYLGVALRDTAAAVQVVEVIPGSPADEAGIAVGDRIVAFNGIEVSSKEQLADLVAGTIPGTQVEVVLGGPGGGRIVEVTIGARG